MSRPVLRREVERPDEQKQRRELLERLERNRRRLLRRRDSEELALCALGLVAAGFTVGAFVLGVLALLGAP